MMAEKSTRMAVKSTQMAVKSTDVQFTSVRSPIGVVMMGIREDALCALGFEEGWDRLVDYLHRRWGSFTPRNARSVGGFNQALASYFEGDLGALDGLPVDLQGGTPFQQKVWNALRKVRVGTTASYAELGRRAGFPNASRAVGAANGSNPVSLVVPCHRVIRSDGTLCGYGWGVERKRWLLEHEGVLLRGLTAPSAS
jgi:methylated-DNA-[protein]-cysteine S-methyltransferase